MIGIITKWEPGRYGFVGCGFGVSSFSRRRY